jgi:hypothetical protein
MVGGKLFGILRIFQLSISILLRDYCPCQSNLGGLVPGWNLVLVCWERETVSRRMDDQLVAVWAHSLGALVMAFVAAATTAVTTAAAATAATTTAAATAISLGHIC